MTRFKIFDDEVQPGSDRERIKGSMPLLVGDLVAPTFFEHKGPSYFPVQSWAVNNGFRIHEETMPFLRVCGSAAELFFAREFAQRPGVTCTNGVATARDGTRCELQARVASYSVDAVVTRDRFRLAVEIDGIGFHQRSADQIGADYIRQRRIVCAGYTVVRFTAAEAFKDPGECWRQIDIILERNG